MKRILAILLTIFLCATASAQITNSIVLDRSTFRAVQSDALTGVAVDPIGVDRSRRACARLKIFFHRMTREQMAQLEPVFPSGTIDYTKCKVAEGNTVLILEFTARPQVQFYLKHPTFGTSNELELSLEGNKEYQLEATLNQTFSIVVESNVVGAEVYIDGVFKGQTGDNRKCTVSDVMIGEHRLKVVYGATSGQRLIDVNKNAISFTQNVDIVASEPQYVVFAVEPKTASVIIDDKPLPLDEGGAVTTVLQAGTYSYSVSAKMYHTQRGTFTVAGAKVQKSVALAPAFGYLSVGGGMVNGATVFVDDENIGTAPVKSDKLASGEHSVRIVKGKYKPYSTTVTIRDNQTTTLAPTLSADFATVTLTTASGASIWVNGTQKGVGNWSGELATGTYIFEARQSGHRPAQISQTIAAIPSRQSYAIPAPTPIVGSVDITSSPAMADITLDDKQVGTTPLKLSNLLVGQHKVTVSKSGYQPYRATVTVAEGKTATVNATLKKQVAQTPNTTPQTFSNRKTSAPYKVGDYYNDGVKEGVVFEVSADGRHGKIVSMKQSAKELLWASDSAEQKRFIGANSETNGAYKMAKVKAIPGWETKYPAFKWCADLGEGWYLPSIDELKTFTLNDAIHDAVNRTLIARCGTKLYDKGEEGWYWSSTEYDYKSSGGFCAWYASMYNGYTSFSGKYNTFYVRAVSAFGDSSKTESAVTTVSNRKTSVLYKVGDFYNENGKQGVVFEVRADGRHGKIVSMKRAYLQWSSDYAEQKRLIGADSETDGAVNMAKVKAISGWRDKYPAFKWCADLGEGWYLPSKEELITIYKNTDKVDSNLTDKLSSGWYYWSSTEKDYKLSGEFCACYVDMSDGSTGGGSKSLDCYVRAVSAF